MKLMHEGRGFRIYLADDGTNYEVRPQLRGRTAEMAAASFDIPEIAQVATRMLVESLLHDVREFETIGDVAVSEDRFDWQPFLTDEAGEPIRDEDGDFIEDPDADPIQIVRLFAEIGFWPTPTEGAS